VPKVTLKWLPFSDELALRSTWGKSFSAPTLFSLYGPASIGFTENLDGQIEAIPGHEPISGQANGLTGSNPNLKPSLGKNLTFGLVYAPKFVKGLSLTLDYFRIKQTDLISSIGAFTILQDVETYGAASPYANLVKLGSFNGTAITAPGEISGNSPDNVYVTDQLVNIAKQTMSGYNFTAKYTFKVAELGKFDLSVGGLLWDSYKVQFLPTTDPYETAGLVTNTNGTLNRWKTYVSGGWERGNWSAGTGISYWVASTDDNDGSHIPPVAQVDLSVGYRFDSSVRLLNGLKVKAGVNNVFNKFGPLDPTTFSDSNVDIATYGPVGRLIYVEASYKF
jgi:iron complex outermembrane receptor protein